MGLRVQGNSPRFRGEGEMNFEGNWELETAGFHCTLTSP